MSSIGTFGAFTQARLAIYAAQAGLSVTGNNISNINTDGYTRQKLDQTSFYAGGTDRYYSTYELRIGNGTLCNGVSQLRDPFLDIRYRTEMANVGAMDTKLAVLQDLQAILDEVGDGDDGFGIISAQLEDLLYQLQQLSDQTGVDNYDVQVRSSAESLVKQLNSYAAQLEQTYTNTMIDFKQDIKKVNGILTQIRELNSSIRKSEIHGENALELRDERNLLIDELSSYMKIKATYEEEDIGGITVEKLVISLDNANPVEGDPNSNDTARLVDGIYAVQLSVPDKITLDANGAVVYGTEGNGVQEVDNTNLIVFLEPLKDSQGRPLYSTQGTTLVNDPEAEAALTAEPPIRSLTETDENGVITIKTYSETIKEQLKANPLYDAEDPNSLPYLDKNGVPTNDVSLADTVQVTVYNTRVYTKTPCPTIRLADNDLYGSLQSQRELLTESGEFASQETIDNVDPNAGTKRGIPYYQKSLDLLANKLATVLNDANQGYVYNTEGNYVDEDGNELVVNGQPISKHGLTEDQINYILQGGNAEYIVTDDDGNRSVDLDKYLASAGGDHRGVPLFSNRGDGDSTEGITASNISISYSWSKGPQIVNSFERHGNLEIGTTDSSNISHIISLLQTQMTYNPQDVDPNAASDSIFVGTFSEMWINVGTVLGNDMSTTQTMLDTYYSKSLELDTNRDSVSSVDLNDEAMNLMQYSKSYNAACRLMTTIDSVLDKLINGTGH